MRPLMAQSVVELWERGQSRGRSERSLAMLRTAFPEHDPVVFADLPIGEYDALLLRLHERSFGSSLESQTRCPGCTAVLSFSLDVNTLIRGKARPSKAAETLRFENFEVRFRLPNANDLRSLANFEDVPAARAHLLGSCVLACFDHETQISPQELPEEVIAAVTRRMEELDPLAEIPLHIDCRSCGHTWEAILDIGSYLWVEISTMAERLLHEVHTLAQAYGWTESEVLALGPTRRHYYLGLANNE